MTLRDPSALEKRRKAEQVERVGPVRFLRSTLETDPRTFNTLVLAAIGPLEASRIGPNPTDEELAWIGRELLALLRGESEVARPLH